VEGIEEGKIYSKLFEWAREGDVNRKKSLKGGEKGSDVPVKIRGEES